MIKHCLIHSISRIVYSHTIRERSIRTTANKGNKMQTSITMIKNLNYNNKKKHIFPLILGIFYILQIAIFFKAIYQ